MSQEIPATEINILHRYRYLVAAYKFKLKLWKKRDSIAALIKYHLRLQADDTCIVLPQEQWTNGCFNVCVRVEVTAGNSTRSLIFRCPVPPLAGQQAPGRNDEKLGCEVGTYIYMQQNCPDIRIPELFAFGFTDDSSFVHVQQTPIYTKFWRKAWKWIYRCLGYPILSDYIHEKSAPAVGTAYMLMEHIGPETGKMLSTTLFNESTDATRRKNLFTGLARTMLSLARIPQQHIGSFRFNSLDCTIALSNRPLTCTMAVFEQEGAKATIPEDRTYQNTDSFVSDMLAMHDNHLIHNPHAVVDADDAKDRIAILSLLRVVKHFFVLPERRSGPYFLQATDMHASNILVDEEWNITCIIDLEWISALPVEMMHVPTWIIKRSTEQIIDHYDEYDEARKDFMSIMDQEMKHVQMEHDIPIAQIMRDSWESKGTWYWLCIEAVNLWLFLFEDHIMPMFSSNKGLVSKLRQLFRFWHKDANNIIETKAVDEKRYQSELRSLVESGQKLPKI